MTEQKTKQNKVWSNFWKRRKKSLIGNLLFLIRKKFFAKGFVNLAKRYSKKGKVLEAGCGTALSTIFLGKERGDEIYALDFLPEALEEARRFAKLYKQKIKLVKGDLFNIPFNDKTFDLCWNIGTIEHFKDPLPAIKEMKRVGKVVIVLVPAHSPIYNNYLKIINLIGPKVEGYVKLYRAKELKSLFKKVGFKRIKIKVIRSFGFPYIAAIGK